MKSETKRTKENNNTEENKRNETNNERQNQQSSKGIDIRQEEMDILKSDVSQIKKYIKTLVNKKTMTKKLEERRKKKKQTEKNR